MKTLGLSFYAFRLYNGLYPREQEEGNIEKYFHNGLSLYNFPLSKVVEVKR